MKRAIFTTPQEAEAAFYEAFEKADLEAMMAVWADDEDIVCVHPGGIRLSGMAQVREAWRQIFAGGQTLRFRLRHQQSLNGMTLVVHSAYEQVAVAGEAQARNPVIVTNIYMRTENGCAWSCTTPPPRPRAPKPRASARRRRCIRPRPAVKIEPLDAGSSPAWRILVISLHSLLLTRLYKGA